MSLTINGYDLSASKLNTARNIDGVAFDGSYAISHYCECSTAAATAAKTVTLANFNLVTGASVKVKFTNTNTASSPTLNVNSTGAKAIKYRNATIPAGYLAASRIYEFVYDGADWEVVGDITTHLPVQYSSITPTNEEISDVLKISTTDPYSFFNMPHKVYQMSTDTTAIANMPDKYPQGTGFVGMRYVHYFSSTNILVELMEFPGGRRWYNNYVTNKWNGWKCEPKNADGESMSNLRDDLEEIGTYTSTSYAEVGYKDEIVVGATICMQKLSKTICNLYISYKIWTNNETDSNIFYFMSGEKIRNALGLKTLAAVASQSQVTFTPSFDVDSNGNLTVVSAQTALGVMGHTGIKAVIDATGIQMGRIYDSTGAYGSWPVGPYSDSLFKVNTYGQINFYGARYSI